MSKNLIETVMGAVVLAVAGGFLAFAYQSAGLKPMKGYVISANFKSASGLSVGSDVRIGGIKVGVVSDMTLNPDTYQAIVKMQVKDGTKVPEDSTASIVGDGLLGGKYIDVAPGGSDTMLAANGTIQFTQPAVNLETLIGKFMFSGGGVDGKEKEEKSDKKTATPPDGMSIE